MAESRQGKVPPPTPLAMVICDAIWRDPGTGKRVLLGCFSVVHAYGFPATHELMAVYIAVTNGRGTVPVRVQLVDADEEHEPLWSAEAELEFVDPREVVEIDLAMVGVTFPAPGEYRLQLFAADELTLERRVVVNQLPEVPT